MMIKIVEKYEPREYSALSRNNGIVLCDKKEGAFLVLRCPEDIERLKNLLETVHIKRVSE